MSYASFDEVIKVVGPVSYSDKPSRQPVRPDPMERWDRSEQRKTARPKHGAKKPHRKNHRRNKPVTVRAMAAQYSSDA